MEILSIYDKEFRKFGAVMQGVDCSELVEMIGQMECPKEVGYEADYLPFHELKAFDEIQKKWWGEGKIEIGYCIGHNNKLNGLEYHRSSEINLACMDVIVLLGKREDIDENYQYSTDQVKAFLIPKGVAVEFYATTLHFAPCGLKENDYAFRTAVVLPYGTNFPLAEEMQEAEGEDRLLLAQNKWLLAHAEGGQGDAWIGLQGENIEVI